MGMEKSRTISKDWSSALSQCLSSALYQFPYSNYKLIIRQTSMLVIQTSMLFTIFKGLVDQSIINFYDRNIMIELWENDKNQK